VEGFAQTQCRRAMNNAALALKDIVEFLGRDREQRCAVEVAQDRGQQVEVTVAIKESTRSG
jgi:hypothetical protein